jgi:predicted O-methyltransferase YrrM
MSTAKKVALLCARLARIAFTNPGGLSHVLGTALSVSADVTDRSADLLRLPRVAVEDLLPEEPTGERIRLAVVPKTNASVSLLETLALVLLMRQARAESIFEFGTYKGVSITQLALNVPAHGRIYTLDLPDDPGESLYPIPIAKDAVLAREPVKGSLVPADLRERIQFLRQDSAKFDETPFRGAIDFVFVDGAHNLEYVRNDSEKGWRMLRPGGIIAWHDCCSQDPDVVRYLLNCPFKPTRITSTSLAFAVKT